MPRPAIRTLTLTLAVSLVIFGTGCSGGGGGGGGGGGPPTGGQIRANVTSVNNNFVAVFGLIGVTYTVSGPPNTVYNTSHAYSLGASSALASASQTPQGLATQANASGIDPSVTVAQTQTMNLTLPATEGGGEVTSAPITFWWYAYADLGFISGSVLFQVLPSSAGLTTIPNSPGGLGGGINYPGAPSQASSGSSGTSVGDPSATGAPAGGSGGRAGHTATSVRSGSAPGSSGLNVLVAGGYDGGASSPNAFDSMDRFEFDANSFSHVLQFSGAMTPGSTRRAGHASAFFIDPNSGAINVLTTGGRASQGTGPTVEHASGNVYRFSPTEQVTPTDIAMQGGARVDHTACWVPCNQVIIIGGTKNGVVQDTIEHYLPDASGGSFLAVNATLGFARSSHECALLADGRVFIAGGDDGTAAPGTLPCEIYDPLGPATTTLSDPGGMMLRVDHTVTRMANGWILIVGGRSPATGALWNTAVVFKPEDDSFVSINFAEARALHTATLLGDKNVLVTGGEVSSATYTGFTTSAQVFSVDGAYPAGFTTMTILDALNEARGEHTATATDQGSVFVIGGRNDVGGGVNFLDSIEFFAFSNDVPAVANAMTAVSTNPNSTMNITVDVTDANQDGGYVIIRYRKLGGLIHSATIISQSPSTSSVPGYPNMMVEPGSYTFTWDYTADGVAPGEDVEIEIIPVGAVIGSPLLLVGKAQ